MKKTELKSKSLKMTLKSLAFALGLVATTSTTSMAMPIQQTTKVESHSHDEHEHDIEIENVVVKVETNNSNNVQKSYKLISIREVPNYSISNYKGSSIVEALNTCGIDASFSNRKLMATNLGIENYKGTAIQNTTLLNMLKEMNMESYAKVSDITRICQSLFGINVKNVIADLELPTTKNLTKSDFARIIRKIANHMNVDTTTYDNKLGLVLDTIKDIDLKNKNNNDIAWSYYMGYTDIDENSNFNGNKILTVNELNEWSQSFVKDYNLAVTTNTVNANGLIIKPSQDKYVRDKADLSKINDIRNPKVQTPANVSPSVSNDDHNKGKDDHKEEEKHVHKYGKWKYYDEEKESSTCKDCGKTKYRKHSLGATTQTTYVTNNDETHKVIEVAHCDGCNTNISKVHTENCDMGEWVYNKIANLEIRDCDLCGYEATRAHEHADAPANLVYTLDRTNGNGTHKLKAVYDCNICDTPITVYKDENCDMGPWLYNSETQKEERECTVCYYEETKEHEHVQAPENLVYTLDKSNENGTHKLKAVYDCNICNNTITLYKDENCNYSDWHENNGFTCKKECEVCDHEVVKNHDFATVENSVTSNPTVGKHNVTEKCNDCGTEQQVEVSCTGDGNIYYHTEGDTVTERENCAVCGDVCLDTTHSHDFGNTYTCEDENNHIRECDCGEIDRAAHHMGEWTVDENGVNTRECEDCDYVETKEHQCIRSDVWVKADDTIEGSCYDMVLKCTDDSCGHIFERQGYDHDYVATELPELNQTYYECSVCHDYYTEAIEQALMMIRNTLVQTDEEEIEETQEPTLDPKELDIYKKEEKEEELDDVQKTEPEKEPEPEFEQLDIYKEEDEELEEEENKVLVLK